MATVSYAMHVNFEHLLMSTLRNEDYVYLKKALEHVIGCDSIEEDVHQLSGKNADSLADLMLYHAIKA